MTVTLGSETLIVVSAFVFFSNTTVLFVSAKAAGRGIKIWRDQENKYSVMLYAERVSWQSFVCPTTGFQNEKIKQNIQKQNREVAGDHDTKLLTWPPSMNQYFFLILIYTHYSRSYVALWSSRSLTSLNFHIQDKSNCVSSVRKGQFDLTKERKHFIKRLKRVKERQICRRTDYQNWTGYFLSLSITKYLISSAHRHHIITSIRALKRLCNKLCLIRTKNHMDLFLLRRTWLVIFGLCENSGSFLSQHEPDGHIYL